MLGDHQHGFAMVYDRAHLGRRERGVDRYRYCADRPDRKGHSKTAADRGRDEETARGQDALHEAEPTPRT